MSESVLVLQVSTLPGYIDLRITLLPRSMLCPKNILVGESVLFFDLVTVVFYK